MKKVYSILTIMFLFYSAIFGQVFQTIYLDFEDPNLNLPDGWIVLEGGTNSGMNSWHPAYNTAGNGNEGSFGFLSISLNSVNPKDSWFVSDSLLVSADKLYKITFYYNTLAQGAYEYMEVKFGTEQTIAGMTNQIWDNQNINTYGYKQGTCYMKPETDGIYYVAFHAYSEPAEFNIMLDDVTIEELDAIPGAYAQPNDLHLPICSVNDSLSFNLNIKNQGFGTLELLNADYPDFISGPESFEITDEEDIEFKIKPQTQGILYDTIKLFTNGGNILLPVLTNSAVTVYPINSMLTMQDYFTVINVGNDLYTWRPYWEDRTFEGEYSFQVQENWDCTGYDDWLITNPVYVMPNDVFTFIARSEDALNGPGQIRVMLSTSAGSTVSDFDLTLQNYFYIPGEWTTYSYDLSDYAGQIVTLAIHSYSTTSVYTMAHYFDNIGFSSETNPLTCTDAVYPSNNQTNVPKDTIFEWYLSQPANDYLLYLGTDNPPTNFLNGVNTGNTNTYEVENLSANTTYFWQIVPVFGEIEAESCDILSFTTGDFVNSENIYNNFSIYSFSNKIFINNNQESNYDIKIYTTDGRCIYENYNLSDNKKEIEIDFSGMIIVHLISEKNLFTKKLILIKYQ